ncbi:MAG: hypothetical protein R3A52_02955 [Polyangiales bacterium]
MSDGAAMERARAMAAEMATALASLRCRGHVVAVHGVDEPSLAVARRFMVMELWVPWRVPHVMLVPCVLAGERPAVVVGTWDPRGVVFEQTVTSSEAFAAEVARAAARPVSAEDEAAQRRELAGAEGVPDLENDEFWPEVLARMLATKVDEEMGTTSGLPAAIVARIWPERLEDLRERARGGEA